MGAILALLGLWGPKVLGLIGLISSIYDMTQAGATRTNSTEAVISAAAALAKGWNVTGGTVANPNSAKGTIPEQPLTPETPIVDPKAPTVEVKK